MENDLISGLVGRFIQNNGQETGLLILVIAKNFNETRLWYVTEKCCYNLRQRSYINDN